MKQTFGAVCAFFLLLLSLFFFLPQFSTSLPRFSFHFFQTLFQNEQIREVFGLEEETAVLVFGEEEPSLAV